MNLLTIVYLWLIGWLTAFTWGCVKIAEQNRVVEEDNRICWLGYPLSFIVMSIGWPVAICIWARRVI